MWLALILKVGGWLLGLLFGSPGDERDKERAAGEAQGKEESKDANAQQGLAEIAAAVGAGQAARAADSADPDRLRDPNGAAARPYRPGAD